MKQTEILTHATHVNGWFPAVYMSCMSQNFRLFHVSNLSVRNFRIFLLMYPGSLTVAEPPNGPGYSRPAVYAGAARRDIVRGQVIVRRWPDIAGPWKSIVKRETGEERTRTDEI